MILQDVNGRMRNIRDSQVYTYLLNKIPQGTWFYVFVYISMFIVGFLVGGYL